ncbi:hypothetical protein EMEDMD4_280147 [Sinorhizobium medicae]|uniref:Uncharacterized protein n=1 Tax=Sinorhizobium medicae TaxID=110321 RepID=A0A508WVN5_9HYPH|nr:hypothetical protein EMEDMD4_280147 [Sinorhizobium medicae]
MGKISSGLWPTQPPHIRIANSSRSDVN